MASAAKQERAGKVDALFGCAPSQRAERRAIIAVNCMNV